MTTDFNIVDYGATAGDESAQTAAIQKLLTTQIDITAE